MFMRYLATPVRLGLVLGVSLGGTYFFSYKGNQMKKEILICDICKSEENVDSCSFIVRRFTDEAGSMDTECAHYELCVDCYMRTLRMSYQSLNFSTLEMLDNLHIESIKKLQSKK